MHSAGSYTVRRAYEQVYHALPIAAEFGRRERAGVQRTFGREEKRERERERERYSKTYLDVDLYLDLDFAAKGVHYKGVNFAL